MSSKDARMGPGPSKPCLSCKGSRTVACINCHGTGRHSGMVIDLKHPDFPCSHCGGSGKKPCNRCGGSGKSF